MEMMLSSGHTYTRDSLETAIVERFGSEARFHTCSAENMTPRELVNFLVARNKFIDTGEGFVTDPDKICDH